jgi:chromosome partitioning protein
METVVVVNQKGGVGKTTTSVCLSGAFVERGRRVLLIDLDPQEANSTNWLLGQQVSGVELLNALVEGEDLAAIISPTESCIDLIPCGVQFAGYERQAGGKVGAEFFLKEAIERLPDDIWDLVFIDCPPNLGLVSISALIATRLMLVPVETNSMSLDINRLFETTEEVRRRLNADLQLAGIVCTQADFRRNHTQDVIDALRGTYGKDVCQTVIRDNTHIAECYAHHTPITRYDARSNGAKDYIALAKELETRIRKMSKGKG